MSKLLVSIIIALTIVTFFTFNSHRKLSARLQVLESGRAELTKGKATTAKRDVVDEMQAYEVVDGTEDRLLQLEQEVARLRSELKVAKKDSPSSPLPSQKAQAVSAVAKATTEVTEESFSQLKMLIGSYKDDFPYYDRNGNGQIDPDELDEVSSAYLQFDFNKNGIVEDYEPRRAERFIDNANRYANDKDTQDKSFPIDKANFDGRERQFDFIDADDDNVVEEHEYFAFLKQGWKEARRFDLNYDGKIMQDEFGGSATRFTAFDYDKNGYLEQWEVRRALVLGKW